MNLSFTSAALLGPAAPLYGPAQHWSRHKRLVMQLELFRLSDCVRLIKFCPPGYRTAYPLSSPRQLDDRSRSSLTIRRLKAFLHYRARTFSPKPVGEEEVLWLSTIRLSKTGAWRYAAAYDLLAPVYPWLNRVRCPNTAFARIYRGR